MGATGTAVLNFGVFPGADQASVAVTGQPGILSGSRVEAWIDPTQGASADHSVGEHVVADIDCRCEAIVAGTGFTIVLTSREDEQLQYGNYLVAWAWY